MEAPAQPANVVEFFDPNDRYVLTLKGFRAIGAEPISIFEELYEQAEEVRK